MKTPATPCAPQKGASADLGPLEDRAAELELAALARALAHPARVRIVKLLAGRSTCICGEIVDELDLAQSTVSQHLKVMKEAGLVQGEIDGPRTCYCLSPHALRRLRILIGAL